MVLAVGWEEELFDVIFYLGSLSPPFAFFEIAGRPHDMSFGKHEGALRQGALVGTFIACAIATWLSLGQFLKRRNWDKGEKNMAVHREPPEKPARAGARAREHPAALRGVLRRPRRAQCAA